MHRRRSPGWLILGLAVCLAGVACARPAPPQPDNTSTDDLDVEPGSGAARAGVAEEVKARVSLAPRYPDRTLLVVETNREEKMECRRHDLALRLVRGGQAVPQAVPQAVAEAVLDGVCTGACTPADKQAGEAALAEAKAQVEAGASESILDHDFTGCVFHGSALGRAEEQAGRSLVLLVGNEPGPHDVPHRFFRLATAVCDRVFVSQPFGSTYANRWEPDDLHLAAGADGAVIVTARDEGASVEVYRVTFPADDCAAPPVERVGDAEAG